MATTRSMTAKQNKKVYTRKRSRTLTDSRPWASLIPDILFSIIMRLGVFDFGAFSSVCRVWRTVALSIRSNFILSRLPMTLCVSTQINRRKTCCLQDYEGRKFTTILPRSGGRIYLGLASGYLVLFGRRTRDFLLVNPVTRHELRFPCCFYHVVADPAAFRGTLVFSPTTSSWVFVITSKYTTAILCSLPTKEAFWTYMSSNEAILDLQSIQGRIYALNIRLDLCEVSLEPLPTLTLLKMRNILMVSHFIRPEFATFGERLFVTGYVRRGGFRIAEVDFDEKKWSRANAVELKGHPWFLSISRGGLYKLEFCEEPHALYARYGYFHSTAKGKKEGFHGTTKTWYFPHKCLDVYRLQNE